MVGNKKHTISADLIRSCGRWKNPSGLWLSLAMLMFQGRDFPALSGICGIIEAG